MGRSDSDGGGPQERRRSRPGAGATAEQRGIRLHSIRDLTGVDLRPAREFPVDPANSAGFDNSGESLTMSPALLQKYLEAAREVFEHPVLKPNGFTFAPHPMLTDTDRDKYCVQRIVEFYHRQPTDFADYFPGPWRYQHRAVPE